MSEPLTVGERVELDEFAINAPMAERTRVALGKALCRLDELHGSGPTSLERQVVVLQDSLRHSRALVDELRARIKELERESAAHLRRADRLTDSVRELEGEKGELHDLLSGAFAALDPDAYSELSGRIENALDRCGVACEPAEPPASRVVPEDGSCSCGCGALCKAQCVRTPGWR